MLALRRPQQDALRHHCARIAHRTRAKPQPSPTPTLSQRGTDARVCVDPISKGVQVEPCKPSIRLHRHGSTPPEALALPFLFWFWFWFWLLAFDLGAPSFAASAKGGSFEFQLCVRSRGTDARVCVDPISNGAQVEPCKHPLRRKPLAQPKNFLRPGDITNRVPYALFSTNKKLAVASVSMKNNNTPSRKL